MLAKSIGQDGVGCGRNSGSGGEIGLVARREIATRIQAGHQRYAAVARALIGVGPRRDRAGRRAVVGLGEPAAALHGAKIGADQAQQFHAMRRQVPGGTGQTGHGVATSEAFGRDRRVHAVAHQHHRALGLPPRRDRDLGAGGRQAGQQGEGDDPKNEASLNSSETHCGEPTPWTTPAIAAVKGRGSEAGAATRQHAAQRVVLQHMVVDEGSQGMKRRENQQRVGEQLVHVLHRTGQRPVARQG